MYIEKPIKASTAMEAWNILILEACGEKNLSLPKEVEHYLVSTCAWYIKDKKIILDLLGPKLLFQLEQSRQAQPEKLRAIGDSSLLIAGLFPRRRHYAHLGSAYWIGVGRSAYSAVACLDYHQESLFRELCRCFSTLVQILRTVERKRRIDENYSV